MRVATAFRNPSLDQTLRQFERDARATQSLARIFATCLIGIDHRQRRRHTLRTGKMMVGDDQVDAQPPGGFGRGEGADAHVHADDELDAGGGGALDDVVAHVVAVADAVRNMKVSRAAAQLNRGFEDDDRGGAVDVVVAIDQDLFFVLDRGFDPVDGGLHAGHQIGRMQMRERGRQETLGSFGCR